MSWLRDLQLLAMHSVVKQVDNYELRYIFRWYSRTFHTPLHVVESLPLEDVLRHYYEVQFEDLEEVDLKEQIRRLIMNPAKLARLRLLEDAEDADMYEFGKMAAAAPPPTIPVAKTPNPIADKMAQVQEQLKNPQPIPGKDASLPTPVIEEGIHMEFEDIDIPDLDDMPSFAPSEEKPKG